MACSCFDFNLVVLNSRNCNGIITSIPVWTDLTNITDLDLTTEWYVNIDQALLTSAAFLDLTKAFDTV